MADGGGAQRGCHLIGEPGGEVGVAIPPQHQRRRGDLAQPLPGAGEHVGRRAAVELEDRALRALIEVLPHAVDELPGQRTRGRARRAGELPRDPAVRRAHHELAEQRRSPGPRDAVPAVPGQERDHVHHHQALHPLGRRLREREPDGAPVVHDEAVALDAHVLEEALEEVPIAGDRVVEVGALAGAAEPGQVGRQAPGPLEERHPVVRARRDAVQVQHRGAVARCAAPEDRLAVDVLVVVLHAAREHSRRATGGHTTTRVNSVPTLCLGEAIVDLVCERPVTDPAEADAFRPHFGGAAGNVAYTAAAMGGRRRAGRRRGRRPMGTLAARSPRAGRGGPALVRAARRSGHAGRARHVG